MELDEQTKVKLLKVLRGFPRIFVVAPEDCEITFEPFCEDGFRIWAEQSYYGHRFHAGNLFHLKKDLWELLHKKRVEKVWTCETEEELSEINIFSI